MSEPIKLVTRAGHQTTEMVVEKLRQVIAEIEGGELRGVTQVVVVFQMELDEDSSRYPLRTNGMMNSQALWLLEQGKRVLMAE